jgi:hypothetical protein
MFSEKRFEEPPELTHRNHLEDRSTRFPKRETGVTDQWAFESLEGTTRIPIL